jgi:hypothetical protein
MASLSHAVDETTDETVQKQSNTKSKPSHNRGEKKGVKLTQHVALVVEQRHIFHWDYIPQSEPILPLQPTVFQHL